MPHTRIPVYDGSIDNIIGILHMKKVAQVLARGELDREQAAGDWPGRASRTSCRKARRSNVQLLKFQRQRRRIAFIVDEYGDMQGLVTLEDMLEEIVGEFTSGTSALHKDMHRERPDSFVVNASASVRMLNRKMGWTLPTTGPRTLNGLIVEYLETIPEPGTSLRIGDYSLEILQTGDNTVKTVRLKPITPDAGASDANQVAQVGLRSSALRSALRRSRLDAEHLEPLERLARHIRLRHHRAAEALLRSFAQPLLAKRHRPDFAGETKFAEADGVGRERLVAQARQHGEHRRQVGRGFADPHAADDVDEDIASGRRNAAVPMQHREQQREPARLPSRRRRGADSCPAHRRSAPALRRASAGCPRAPP